MNDLEGLIEFQQWCTDARELGYEAWSRRCFGHIEAASNTADLNAYIAAKTLLRSIHPEAHKEGWVPRTRPRDRRKVYEFCRNFVSKEEPTLPFDLCPLHSSKEADV